MTHPGRCAQVWALLQGGADAAQPDARGKTPYAVAASKEVRDAFRRHVAAAGPDLAWEPAAAGVPSALTPEMEAAQAARQVRPTHTSIARPPARAVLEMQEPGGGACASAGSLLGCARGAKTCAVPPLFTPEYAYPHQTSCARFYGSAADQPAFGKVGDCLRRSSALRRSFHSAL